MQLRSLFCACAQEHFFLRTEIRFSSRSKIMSITMNIYVHNYEHLCPQLWTFIFLVIRIQTGSLLLLIR